MSNISIVKKTLSVEEAAELIGCTPWKIYQMVKTREIPHYRVGSKIRFTDIGLSRWMQDYEKNAYKYSENTY